MSDPDSRFAPTDRVPLHRSIILQHFGVAWDGCKELSFASLLVRAIRAADPSTLSLLDLERFDDARLAEILRHYATMREIPTRPGVR